MPSFFYGVFLDINNRSAVWGNFRVSGLDPLFTSAFLPTGFAARWSANRTTDAGFVMSYSKGDTLSPRTLVIMISYVLSSKSQKGIGAG